MFTIDFFTSPEKVGKTLGVIPQFRSDKAKWEQLSRAVETLRISDPSHSNKLSTALARAAAADLINDSIAPLKVDVTVRVDMILFELPQNQHVSLLPHPTSRGYLSVHARLGQPNVDWILGALVENLVAFTATPSDPVSEVSGEKSVIVTPSVLTRRLLGQLNELYEEPRNLAGFYDNVFPHLQELFLYATAYLAIRDKWNRRDWLMDGIIAHVKRVLTEVKGCLERKAPSVFEWVDETAPKEDG